MTRSPRHSYLIDNGFYHVISRSINNTVIFKDNADFMHFLNLERHIKRLFPIRLFHYVLMQTHFHLVVQTIKAINLPDHIMRLKRAYTRWYQKKYIWSGPLWRERYRSIPIEDENYLSACGLYVELNPVRAGICKESTDYMYSSARKYELGQKDDLLDEYDPTPVSEALTAAASNPLVADQFFTQSKRFMVSTAAD